RLSRIAARGTATAATSPLSLHDALPILAVDHGARQAEFHAQAAHLVLEQLAQRFDQAELHVLGQAADVVVALDDVGLAGAHEARDRKSTRLNSSHVKISYAVFCLQTKKR